MKWRVYIATTEGPVAVQRLAEEDPEIRSVVCLNGTSEALPISAAYDAFVRKPTGVIERLYGHPSFRMDVSGPISAGRSWQLGALVVHALHAKGMLAGKDQAADQALWLTGEVDHELGIRRVTQVEEKLIHSSDLFHELREQGIPLTLISAKSQDGLNDAPPGAGLIQASQAQEVFQALGLEEPDAQSPRARKSRLAYLAWGALAVSIGATAYLALESRDPSPAEESTQNSPVKPRQKTQMTPPSNQIPLSLQELRPPPDSNCAGIQFGKVSAVALPLQPDTAGVYRSSDLQDLCGLRWQAALPLKGGSVILRTKTLAGNLELPNGPPHHVSGADARWQVLFSPRVRRPFHYQWFVEWTDASTSAGVQANGSHRGDFKARAGGQTSTEGW